MGLFKNIKNILFDEEEDYTSQIKITPEMRNEEEPKIKEMPKVETPVASETPVKPVVKRPAEAEETSERAAYKNDTTFPFFDLDEDEFNKSKPMPKEEKPKVQVPTRSANVLEYEKRKRTEKRTDYGRYERSEVTETVERKKFKPSPIISPVYGVLNQDYKKDDILKRDENEKVDIETVRNKAFGDTTTIKTVTREEKPKTKYYDEEETVTITIPEEKERKVKTIDELLEDTTDIVVNADHDLEVDEDDFITTEPTREIPRESIKQDPDVENDTLENDLFDLIDSMYDEDGE